jgi:hypothetical protein
MTLKNIPLEIALGLLIVSAILTVYKSDDAVPGDLLYPTDRAMEFLMIEMSPGLERKQNLEVRFAMERILELKEVERRHQVFIPFNPTFPALNTTEKPHDLKNLQLKEYLKY